MVILVPFDKSYSDNSDEIEMAPVGYLVLDL